jgi:uncharacterized membrane protein
MTLRDKLAALTAPCAFTDELVAYAAGWTLEEDEQRRAWWVPPGEDVSEDECKLWPPAYTASLDAAIELVEREMPGAFWAVNMMDADTRWYIAEVGDRVAKSEHTLPAVALLLALLEAKEVE